MLERGLLAIPGSPPLVTLLAERSLLARRFGEARRIAEQMSARTPQELAARHQLVARALAGQGRVAEAIEQARSAAAARPDDPGALLAVASYCEQAGRLDDAIAAVERAATLGGKPEALAARLEGLRKARQAQRDRRMGESLLRP
ncbi:MAG: tetratricopeptide repeat protein [Anaeromyxobacter sp.]|nr:tetratricopeptide repeat protein [Anaeromyxobacter sp.]